MSQKDETHIKFRNVKKRFPGQYALKDISFGIKKGEIHSVLGENGAGKSTLLNILHGVFTATSGEVLIDNKVVNFSNAHEAIKFGIAKVHQEINMVPEMTVAQNLLLGCESTRGGFLSNKKMYKETQRLLDTLKCKFKPSDKVEKLSAGEKQMIQIAKALYMNAKIISFDEPTSSLSKNEEETLFEIINKLKDQGVTIIYISHKLEEIFRICDRTTILRDGEYVGTFEMKDMTKETLIKNMVGRDVSMFAKRHKPSCVQNETVLRVENLKGVTGFEGISFELKKGEILGFFGLVGAKRTEVMRTIFGADKLVEGNVYFYGRKVFNASPYHSIKNGIGLLPENRKEQGFVKDLINADNISLASLKKYQKGLFVNKKLKYKNAVEKGKIVELTPNKADFVTSHLSGGNAQKVVLAKWLSTDVDILVFDEPTKGIDVGAKAEIYKLMEEIVAQGKSIIMVSSELPEIMGMSDRIIVMNNGKIAGEFHREEFAEQRILTYALGGN